MVPSAAAFQPPGNRLHPQHIQLAIAMLGLLWLSGAGAAQGDVRLSANPAPRATAVSGGIPSVELSYFVPQSGELTAPVEGAAAIANARRCPNDDGFQVLKLNARLKIVVRNVAGAPISDISPADICVLFNGGTPAQGFIGAGDDSIIANSQFNSLASCPDVRCVQADAPTDLNGVTYLTWIGPGGIRDPFRKWGGYAGDLPVFVLGVQLQGRLTSSAAPGSYTAHVKSFDFRGGGTTASNQGELVNALDINPVQSDCDPGRPYQYNEDFDNDGAVTSRDLNLIKAHGTHKCNYPLAN